MAIALLIYGAISSMPTPAVAAYVSDVVPFRKQKRAYSLQTWAANFGFAIGPIIANQLVKISYSLMFYAEAAVLVFATLLMIVFFKEAGLGVRGVGRSAKRSVERPWNKLWNILALRKRRNRSDRNNSPSGVATVAPAPTKRSCRWWC